MTNLLPLLKRSFSQPAFVVVAIVLFAAAAGLNAATGYLQLHFRKLPVPLTRSLTEVPQRIGPWEQISIDEPLNPEMQDALATDKYVFRTYVDSRAIGQEAVQKLRDEMAQFRDRAAEYMQQRENLKPGMPAPRPPENPLQRVRTLHPQAVIEMALTYYTGLADTVAHIPDRCYIADGYEPTKYDITSWPALSGRPGEDRVRFIVFEDPLDTSGTSLKRNVAYFFHCNGSYVSDPMGVRKRMANLRQRYGYYMKVELQMLNVPAEDSVRAMNDFLTAALPEAEKCVPDWEKWESAR